MSLFTKPINDISYEDVVSFCEQGISEGINLDYKQDFPEKGGLEKTISAFANTYGGIIIIGIVDQDSKPKPPFEGIEYKEKLEERVWNIILDNINPPLFPEIRRCPPEKNKTFIIIRVPQSNETPHLIFNKTHVYIRTGNINKPEELATEEKREWLRNRRRKSEELRESLYTRAEERYHNIFKSKKIDVPHGERTLSFCPLYPQNPLILVEKTESVFENLRAHDIRMRGQSLRLIAGSAIRPIQDGIYYLGLQEETGFFTYMEMNKFGLILYKENLTRIENKEDTKSVHAGDIIRRLASGLETAHLFYNEVRYWGLIQFRFSLRRLLGIRFIPVTRDILGQLKHPSEVEEHSTDDLLPWEFVVSAKDLEDLEFRRSKLIELGKEVHWSFGTKISQKGMEQFLDQMNE